MNDQMVFLAGGSHAKRRWNNLRAGILGWSQLVDRRRKIIAVSVYAFRRSLAITQAQRDRRQRENELFENALNGSSELAPFAYGVVQARALRYFLLAVFIAYIGDIFNVLWPANGAFYVISLYFISQGLRWFNKIERNALEIFERCVSASSPAVSGSGPPPK